MAHKEIEYLSLIRNTSFTAKVRELMLYDKLEHLLLRTTIIQNILIITPKVC